MASYAIGDIQGCYQSFRKLLKTIQFDPNNDRLLLAGDMINRGPDSLKTMAFILEHQNSIDAVLGNHDLHFLAVAHLSQTLGRKDTVSDILQSDLKQPIIDWLIEQPLAFYQKTFNTLMVHAGLPANWSLQNALDYSEEVSQVLRSKDSGYFYHAMYGNLPDQWDQCLQGNERLRFITNALTRMRYCQVDGRLELKEKSSPKQLRLLKPNAKIIPWFDRVNQHYSGHIVFGHWASLQGHCENDKVIALDTGCVWGGPLTAYRLDDQKFFRIKSMD